MHARTLTGESENLEYVFLYGIVTRWLINPPICVGYFDPEIILLVTEV